MNTFSLLVTCEHAGNEVPARYSYLFENAEPVINSHRGWDPGALPLAVSMSTFWKISPHLFSVTRLLIEPNRSLNHPELFSEFSKGITKDQKEVLVNDLYLPYRKNIEETIRKLKAPVLHLSVHTFTPVMNGLERNVDIGLLFDPDRENERKFCDGWRAELSETFPEWVVEFNQPYKGVDDGLTTYLRTRFSNEHYLGIELEWNQKWATAEDASKWYPGIIQSLMGVIAAK